MSEDISFFQGMKTRRQRDLIDRGMAARDCNAPVEPEAFQVLEDISNAGDKMQPPESASQEEAIGQDPTDIPEGIHETASCLCWYHCRFSDRAQQFTQPCAYHQQEN
jgi:hypothetical protein